MGLVIIDYFDLHLSGFPINHDGFGGDFNTTNATFFMAYKIRENLMLTGGNSMPV